MTMEIAGVLMLGSVFLYLAQHIADFFGPGRPGRGA
jgi:hypothetical protein